MLNGILTLQYLLSNLGVIECEIITWEEQKKSVLSSLIPVFIMKCEEDFFTIFLAYLIYLSRWSDMVLEAT